MPEYSTISASRLASCHEDLQKVFRRVLETIDHSILCGFRDKAAQDKAVADGRSKDPWPTSKHNGTPSNAVDAMPWPYSWDDFDGKNGTQTQIKAMIKQGMFIGYVLAIAEGMYNAGEISAHIRSGVDWNGDWNVMETKFMDMDHFQRTV